MLFTIDTYHPEALRVVHRGVGRLRTAEGVLIDVAERVEARITGVTKPGGEQLCRRWNVVLRDHVLDRSLNGLGLNGVDGAESQAEKAISLTLGELGAQCLRELDSLTLHVQTADIEVVRAYITAGGGAVAV